MALVPARSGSKRIPDKNIKLFCGKPLLVHSVLTAKILNIPVYVSTDSARYASVARDAGALTVFRPEELCTDTATDFQVIQHFLQEVRADLVVYLRPTTPLRSAIFVKQAVEMMELGGYDSLRSVELMPESAYKCFRIKFGMLKPLSKVDLTDLPNQKVPKTYHPNGYVDIVRRSVVEAGSLWGSGRYAYMTARVIELDTIEQWEFGEWIVENRRKWSFG